MRAAPLDIPDPAAHKHLRLSGLPTSPPPSPATAPGTIPPSHPPPLHAPVGNAPVDLPAGSTHRNSPPRLHRPLLLLPDFASPALQTTRECIGLAHTRVPSRSTLPALAGALAHPSTPSARSPARAR